MLLLRDDWKWSGSYNLSDYSSSSLKEQQQSQSAPSLSPGECLKPHWGSSPQGSSSLTQTGWWDPQSAGQWCKPSGPHSRSFRSMLGAQNLTTVDFASCLGSTPATLWTCTTPTAHSTTSRRSRRSLQYSPRSFSYHNVVQGNNARCRVKVDWTIVFITLNLVYSEEDVYFQLI